MKMQRQQYKRLYNIVFAIFVVCSFYFVFGFTKSFVDSNFVDDQKVKLALMFNQQSRVIYDQLVKIGEREEADKLIHDPAQLALAIYVPHDEEGKLFLTKYKAIENRVKFCEENLNLISIIMSLIAFSLLYFLIWQVITVSTRYVKGSSEHPLLNSHINN